MFVPLCQKKVLVFLLLIILVSCKKEKVIPCPEPSQYYLLNYEGFPSPNMSEDNRLTIDGVGLGRMLFYEKKLSRDGSISCASCHSQENAFSDINQFSEGVDGLQGSRQSMAVFNMAWNDNEFFWDGRAHTLREQVLMPIQDPLEMDESLPEVIQKLGNDIIYVDQFEKVFGETGIDAVNISLALEQFVHSIVSNRSKYDKFLKGELSLTISEESGKNLFFSNFDQENPDNTFTNCSICHGGSNFENDSYMNNGLDSDEDISDIGRMSVTDGDFDFGAFKVPSLRNIELTPPYMHDGRFETLEEVIDHYNEGIVYSSTVNPTILSAASQSPLLNAQLKADLIAFLKTLTDYELITDDRYSDPF